jgi:hypothetical protein
VAQPSRSACPAPAIPFLPGAQTIAGRQKDLIQRNRISKELSVELAKNKGINMWVLSL